MTSQAVDALVRAFTRIGATQMNDLGISNPRLAVAAVGFRAWQEFSVGVLVTPWAMNLVVLPSAGDASLALGADRRQTWRFPSGEYALMGNEAPECGAFQFCPLFSPMHEFADQARAEATATEIMQGLFEPAPDDESATAQDAGPLPSPAPLSRRGFLRGLLG